MNITGESPGSKAKVSGREASSGSCSSAKSSRFLRTSTSASLMSVPQVKLMSTIEVPWREVERTDSTRSTEDTARSIGSLTSVSMSCGEAPT